MPAKTFPQGLKPGLIMLQSTAPFDCAQDRL